MNILEETYKIAADSEPQAQQIIDEYKAGQKSGGYILKKGSFELKEKKYFIKRIIVIS